MKSKHDSVIKSNYNLIKKLKLKGKIMVEKKDGLNCIMTLINNQEINDETKAYILNDLPNFITIYEIISQKDRLKGNNLANFVLIKTSDKEKKTRMAMVNIIRNLSLEKRIRYLLQVNNYRMNTLMNSIYSLRNWEEYLNIVMNLPVSVRSNILLQSNNDSFNSLNLALATEDEKVQNAVIKQINKLPSDDITIVLTRYNNKSETPIFQAVKYCKGSSWKSFIALFNKVNTQTRINLLLNKNIDKVNILAYSATGQYDKQKSIINMVKNLHYENKYRALSSVDDIGHNALFSYVIHAEQPGIIELIQLIDSMRSQEQKEIITQKVFIKTSF